MSQFYSLTLDTLAPQSCSLVVPNAYYNATDTKAVTISATGASYMYVWVDQTAAPAVPASPTWKAYATSDTFTCDTEGTNYVHALFMDNVGNTTSVITSNSFIYDITAPNPTAVTINGGAAYTTDTEVQVKVTVTDVVAGIATSGVDYITLSGDITETGAATKFMFDDTDREAGYKTVTVHLTALPEGFDEQVRTVNATATDRAANTGSSATATIKLDTVVPAATLTLTTDGTTALQPFVSVREYKAVIEDTSTLAKDIVAYKIWGDFVDSSVGEPTAWTDFTAEELAAHKVVLDQVFTEAEGKKTVNAKVKDDAGHEVTLTSQSVYYDTAAPTVTLAKDVARISDKTGHDTVTLTVNVTDGCQLAQSTNISIYGTNGGEQTLIKTVAATRDTETTIVDKAITVNYAELAAKSLSADGEISFVAKASDMAGKEGTSTAVIVIIDTAAPTGQLTVSTLPYSNQHNNITVVDYIDITDTATTFASSVTDPSGFGTYKAWIDQNPTTTSVPVACVAQAYVAGTAIPTANVNKDAIADGDCYLHVEFTDSLGNAGVIHSASFKYDTTGPINCTMSFGSDADPLTQREQSIKLSATDTTGTVAKVKLWGQIVASESVVDPTAATTEEGATWQNYAAAKTVYLQANKDDASNKNKTIYAKFMDNAGNVSSTLNISRDLESVDPTVTITKAFEYFEGGWREIQNGAVVSVQALKFDPVTITEATEAKPYKYRVFGDISNATAEALAEWPQVEGSTFTFLPLLTNADGIKTINVWVADANGNIGKTSFTVVLDTSAAEITVSDIQGQIVSTNNVKRRTAEGTEQADETREIGATSYVINMADISYFQFVASEALIEYKVVVNTPDLTTHSAIENAHAIPNTNGSINMHFTGAVETGAVVKCLIKGADLKADSTTGGEDGAWEIIVFGKNAAGVWSAYHEMK